MSGDYGWDCYDCGCYHAWSTKICPFVQKILDGTAEKPSNPKDLIGTSKVPLDLVPAIPLAWQSVAHLEGNVKYGLVNWREAGVRAGIYIAAALRHIEKFKEGEWADPGTRVPHLASVCACMNIIMDSHAYGNLIDDRPKPMPEVSAKYAEVEKVVEHLLQLHADKNPVHYTISGPVKKEAR